MEEKRETHEAYGMVGFSRCQGNPRLFKSDIRGGNYITLTIRTASVDHHLSRDWVYGEKELIEVYLSPNQFAELLTTMNYGSGVPCTINHFNGKRMEKIPDRDSEEKIISDGFEKRMRDLSASMKNDIKELSDLFENKKTLSKEDKRNIEWKFKSIVQEVENNFPFVLNQFQESVGKTVVQAKAEIEAQVSSVIHKTGLDSLKSLSVPSLESHKE